MSARPDPDPRLARLRIGVGAALVLVLVALGIAVLVGLLTPRGGATVVSPGGPTPGSSDGGSLDGGAGSGGSAAADPNASATAIYVHILGQVVRPGLYELDEGARAIDAVAAAGGFTVTADQGGINLARFVSDGEQLVVPAVGEVVAGGAGAGAGVGGGGAGGGAGGGSSGGAVGGLVNLNTADVAALDTLPRVGPATAARIIAWREQNGRFTSVDDLLSVTGIGEKTLDGLRELVTV